MDDKTKAAPEEETTLASIHRLMLEMEETRGKMKDMRDNIKDVLMQNEEYKALQEEIKEATTKRQEAKKVLDADRDFQTLNSELDELKFKLKDLQEIMSHHLVTHFNDTREMMIKDPDGEVRQILLNARVGKPEAIIPHDNR